MQVPPLNTVLPMQFKLRLLKTGPNPMMCAFFENNSLIDLHDKTLCRVRQSH